MNFDKMFVWRLVILKGVMYSLLTLITAFVTGVAECDFPSLSLWNKFLIILGVLSSWLLTMMAFLDKSIASVKEEIRNNDVTVITKTDIKTNETNKTLGSNQLGG